MRQLIIEWFLLFLETMEISTFNSINGDRNKLPYNIYTEILSIMECNVSCPYTYENDEKKVFLFLQQCTI